MKNLIKQCLLVAAVLMPCARLESQLIHATDLRLDDLIAQRDAKQGTDLALSHKFQLLFADDLTVVPTIPSVLLEGGVSSATADTMILALQLVGTPPAQRALGEIFSDPRQQHLDRLRAVIAGGAIALPTDEHIARLWGVAQIRQDPRSVDVANTATLALGVLGSGLQASDPARYADVSTGLLSSLYGTADPQERSLLLKAIGNLQDPTLGEIAALYLHDEYAPVRASAAQSIGLMQSDESVDLLAGRLAEEPRGAVRAALVASMARLAPRVDGLTAVHERVLVEAHPQARAVMVEYLGAHLDRIPHARATLEHLFRTDPTNQVRTLAAQALAP